MEGEGYFEFKTKFKPGKCPVKFCRDDCRSAGGERRSIREGTRLCQKHAKRLQRLKNPVRQAWIGLRWSAKRRGIVCTLSFEEFAEIVLANAYLDNSGSQRHQLQIDRIDVTRGYETGNIQILTTTENTIKGNKERWRKHYHGEPLIDDDNEPF